MRIAIITAMAEETLPILRKLGNVVAENTISGVHIRQIETDGNSIYLATSGIGEIRAALAVQLMVDLFDVEAVLNFGFVGAINPKLSVGELVIAQSACHYQFDLSAVDGTPAGQYDGREDVRFELDRGCIERVLAALGRPIRLVNDASADKFVANSEDKKQLAEQFGCDICEMELAGLALACERNGLPLFSLKVVSDKADESATESFAEVLRKGLVKYEEVLPQVLAAISGDNKPLPPVKK